MLGAWQWWVKSLSSPCISCHPPLQAFFTYHHRDIGSISDVYHVPPAVTVTVDEDKQAWCSYHTYCHVRSHCSQLHVCTQADTTTLLRHSLCSCATSWATCGPHGRNSCPLWPVVTVLHELLVLMTPQSLFCKHCGTAFETFVVWHHSVGPPCVLPLNIQSLSWPSWVPKIDFFNLPW